MKVEKTITANVCDFCVRDEPEKWQAWRCVRCLKDACAECGQNYEVKRFLPTRQGEGGGYFTVTIGRESPVIFSAFICDNCGKNELPAHLLRFGFQCSTSEHMNLAG